jgi:predicted Rossmann fold flavoprotein
MKIAVIGGGAAGLMAAAAIVETSPDAEVFIVEKNDSLGNKVIISGGGRCNLTTGFDDVKQVLTRYPRGGKFLTKAMFGFSPKAVRDWFENHGVPVKIEDDMRAFPVSNDGHDVVEVFSEIFIDGKVKVMVNSAVDEIKRNDSGFSIKIKKRSKRLEADKVILTTGGQAYRQTGSTGDGYAFATELGHVITPLAPSLSAFHTQENWPAEVSGLSFPQVRLEVTLNKKKVETTGPMMFTYKGITGPAVFAMSSLVAFEEISESEAMEIEIDLYPENKFNDMQAKLALFIRKNPKKMISSVLGMVVPRALATIICDEVDIDPEKDAGQISKREIEEIIYWVKSVPLNIIARAAGEEFVTAGGVDLSEVNPSTLESKKCPGLYLAGEVLDIDGFTGGFNLQSAWATGRLAGFSAGCQACLTTCRKNASSRA